jgi:hypothetical protein
VVLDLGILFYDNSLHLMILIIFIFGLYFLLVLLGGQYLVYPNNNQIEEVELVQIVNRIMSFLEEVSSDGKLCGLCVKTHSGSYSIVLMMKNKLKDLNQQEILKRSKTFYSILSIVNLFVVYLVFGGPDLITLVLAISAFLLCFTSYASDKTVFLCVQNSLFV